MTNESKTPRTDQLCEQLGDSLQAVADGVKSLDGVKAMMEMTVTQIKSHARQLETELNQVKQRNEALLGALIKVVPEIAVCCTPSRLCEVREIIAENESENEKE